MSFISKKREKGNCIGWGDVCNKNFSKRTMLNQEIENFHNDHGEIMVFRKSDLVTNMVFGVNKKYLLFNDEDLVNCNRSLFD